MWDRESIAASGGPTQAVHGEKRPLPKARQALSHAALGATADSPVRKKRVGSEPNLRRTGRSFGLWLIAVVVFCPVGSAVLLAVLLGEAEPSES